MGKFDVLVVAPFRRAVFRNAISPLYPSVEPIDSPPLIVAGAIENKGLKVNYLPLINLFNGFNEESDLPNLKQLLEEHQYKMLIFNSDNFIPSRSTASLLGVRIVTAIIKDISPSTIIGVTGRLATVIRGNMFSEVPEVDFIIVGEPEEIIGEVANKILHKGLEEAEILFSSLITKRNMDKNVIPCMVRDLENLALPAYHLLKPTTLIYEKFTGLKPHKIPFSIRTTLGCKFRCKFCSGVPNWLTYRKKSGDRVLREINKMESELGDFARISFLEDEIFTKDIEHVEEITKVFLEKQVFLEGLYTHSSLMTKEIAKLLVPVTSRVYFGLDNASDAILKKMGKGQKLDTVLNAIEIARSVGLKVHLEWIIGTPEEDVDSLINSLGTIFNLLNTGIVDNINTYVYCPHPGTEYAENSDKYNLNIIEHYDYMQESGGFPTYETDLLSRNEIFIAYLISQIAILEVKASRETLGAFDQVRNQNRTELAYLFNSIRKNDLKVFN